MNQGEQETILLIQNVLFKHYIYWKKEADLAEAVLREMTTHPYRTIAVNAQEQNKIHWYPGGQCNDPPNFDRLDEERKQAAQTYNLWKDVQKQVTAEGDREWIKTAKEFAADARKRYQAACLLIGWFYPEARKDCPHRH